MTMPVDILTGMEQISQSQYLDEEPQAIIGGGESLSSPEKNTLIGYISPNCQPQTHMHKEQN